MFFPVSRALWWVATPAGWPALLLLFSSVLFRRRLRIAVPLVVLALLTPVVFCSPRVANALQSWVESSARDTSRPQLEYDAVIVLGGDSEGARIDAAVDEVRHGRARHLLISGERSHSQSERLLLRLRAIDVPEDRVVLEVRSRNTRENALESSRVIAVRGWQSLLLVTSAAHAERAVGCFHKLGLRPDVLPVAYLGRPSLATTALVTADAGRMSAAAMHELVGRAVYRLLGYSD